MNSNPSIATPSPLPGPGGRVLGALRGLFLRLGVLPFMLVIAFIVFSALSN